MADPPAPLALVDPEIAGLIAAEGQRQQTILDMVASENLAPLAVREAQGSILTNKYADGYPDARMYDGCEFVDEIERIAIERCCELFGAEHANVQAYSGSSANAAVLYALCDPGDPVLGFDFRHGGHPTHADAETFAGRFYSGANYGVSPASRLIDPDEVRELALRHRPKVIFAGGSCYPRIIDIEAFRSIADEVGAWLVADMAHVAGLVAAGVYPSPVEVADVCTMTVHKTLGGARGGTILCRPELAARIDNAVFPGEQGGPLMHVIAGMAVSFLLAGGDAFAERMARTLAGARTLAAAFNAAESETGLEVVTGGTDSHIVLLDTSRIADAAIALGWLHEIGVNANEMRIAYDAAPEGGCSGLRLGATSLATRGFSTPEFEELAEILIGALGPHHEARRAELDGRARTLAAAFPVAR